MWSQLRELALTAADDTSLRVVVIRGRHDNFSAGADIIGLGRSLAADHDGSQYRKTNAAAEEAVAALPCPVVAAIDGHCVGGGVQLAVACDLRIATPRARFAVTPAKLGISYPARALARLAATVGVAAAKELLLTATTVDADRAVAMGLVQQLVDDLDSGVAALTATLVSMSGFTQMATKQILGSVVSATIDELGTTLEQSSLRSEDLAEGLRAFAEKRSPIFGDRPRNPQ